MDIVLVTIWLFAGVSILYVVHFGLYLMGANLYDVWQERRAALRGAPHRVLSGEECAATAISVACPLTDVPGLRAGRMHRRRR